MVKKTMNLLVLYFFAVLPSSLWGKEYFAKEPEPELELVGAGCFWPLGAGAGAGAAQKRYQEPEPLGKKSGAGAGAGAGVFFFIQTIAVGVIKATTTKEEKVSIAKATQKIQMKK